MQFGKIENGNLTVYDGGSIRKDGRVYVNPSADTLADLGYKPIIAAEMPEEREGFYLVCSYTEGKKNIRQKWEYKEIPTEIAEMEEQ